MPESAGASSVSAAPAQASKQGCAAKRVGRAPGLGKSGMTRMAARMWLLRTSSSAGCAAGAGADAILRERGRNEACGAHSGGESARRRARAVEEAARGSEARRMYDVQHAAGAPLPRCARVIALSAPLSSCVRSALALALCRGARGLAPLAPPARASRRAERASKALRRFLPAHERDDAARAAARRPSHAPAAVACSHHGGATSSPQRCKAAWRRDPLRFAFALLSRRLSPRCAACKTCGTRRVAMRRLAVLAVLALSRASCFRRTLAFPPARRRSTCSASAMTWRRLLATPSPTRPPTPRTRLQPPQRSSRRVLFAALPRLATRRVLTLALL